MNKQNLTQQKQHDISKIANEIQKDGGLKFYWDYNDNLSDEHIIKIIKEEEGLNGVENELYENNIFYMDEVINEQIKQKLEKDRINLSDEEKDELRLECEGLFDLNINDIIKNSKINLRVELTSNEDMIYFGDLKNSETIKYFKKVFSRKYKKEDYEKEINNLMGTEYGLITFYFRATGQDILNLREQIQNGKIELRKGLHFGFFNSWVGGGSILEIELLKNIILNLKDWRIKTLKDEVLKELEVGQEKRSYYEVSIKADNLSKYGIQETYGLGEWEKY